MIVINNEFHADDVWNMWCSTHNRILKKHGDELICLLGMLADHAENQCVREEPNSADCPYCGVTLYALPNHDPLKRHLDFCEQRPAGSTE